MEEQRQIKFRVWDKLAKQMIYPNSHMSMDLNGNVYNLQNGAGGTDYKLMQFTGLKDKNGIGIYEGDILKLDYTSEYEIFDSFGEFVKWSDEEVQFSIFYEVQFYSGDYEISFHEYTVGFNGWVAKLIKDTRKSTNDSTESIRALCNPIKKRNYGAYGLETKYINIVGNIFENPELLK